jgi:hypothetical protein
LNVDEQKVGRDGGFASGAAITRRRLVQYGVGVGAGLLMYRVVGGRAWAQPAAASGLLHPASIPKYVTPLVIPLAMPRSAQPHGRKGRGVDYYRIGVREFAQQILPPSMALEPTTVWSYGSVDHPETFNYPAFTIEASWGTPTRVKWINELVKANGAFRPHLLAVDQTLHWANPPGGARGRDGPGTSHEPYRGPVPIVTHLHGGHSGEEFDGFPEAWYLPHTHDIPPGYARTGSRYHDFKAQAQHALGQAWTPGSAVFQYDNDQRATTMWYHDHTLGMTRLTSMPGPRASTCFAADPRMRSAVSFPGRRRLPATHPGSTTSRSRSRSRTGASRRRAGSSIPKAAPTSKVSSRHSCEFRSCRMPPAGAQAM